MNNIQKIFKEQNEFFEAIEVEQAPSGEWDEYNIAYLVEQAIITGMETIIEEVGTCENCALWGTHECPIDTSILDDNDYCSWFKNDEKEIK